MKHHSILFLLISFLLFQLSDSANIQAWGATANLGSNLLPISYQQPAVTPVDTNYSNKTIIQLDVGDNFVLALAGDGTLYSWGRNNAGQLGDGTTVSRAAPVAVNMINFQKGAKVVAAGERHSVVIDGDGRVLTWGSNSHGQLGNGLTGTDRMIPQEISGNFAGKTIIDVDAGYDFTLALASDGSVFAWGRNDLGQLGTGDTVDRNVPSSSLVSDVLQISAGYHHSAAIVGSSSIYYTWGDNTDNKVSGDGGLAGMPILHTPAKAADYGIAGVVTKVFAGRDHTFIATDQMKLYYIGYSNHSAITRCPSCKSPINVLNATSPVKEVHSTEDVAMVLLEDGSIYLWGRDLYGILPTANPNAVVDVPISKTLTAFGGKRVSSVGLGVKFAVALLEDGNVFSWGKDETKEGYFGNGILSSSSIEPSHVPFNSLYGQTVTQISSGAHHTIIMTYEGDVFTYGENLFGQLGDGSTMSKSIPVKPLLPQLNGVTVASVGATISTSFVLLSNGAVYGFGDNSLGQINPSGGTFYATPTLISVPSLKSIYPTAQSVFAITTDDRLLSWGSNITGTVEASIPSYLNDLDGPVVKAVGGLAFSLVLTASGSLYGIGQNNNFMLDDSGVDRLEFTRIDGHTFTDVAAGYYHVVALTTNGEIVTWGLLDGEAVALEMRNMTAINAAGHHIFRVSANGFNSFALSLEGVVYSWGDRQEGFVDDSTGTPYFKEPFINGAFSLPSNKIATKIAVGETFAAVLLADTCFGVRSDFPEVCSYHGSCIARDTCICESGYYGANCDIPMCYGVMGDDPRVCNSRGTCVAHDTCSCHTTSIPTEYGYIYNMSTSALCDSYSVQHRISGVISQVVVLNDSSVYYVSSDATILSNATVTIMPGTTIHMMPATRITVAGSLVAIGDHSNGIFFDAAVANSPWKSIRFIGQRSVSTLKNVQFQGGSGEGAFGSIEVFRAIVKMESIHFVDSHSYGIYVCATLPRLSSISGNTSRSVYTLSSFCE